MCSKTKKRIISARTAMLFNSPFWGMLALRLGIVMDPGIDPPTACTDGTVIRFHPKYVEKLSDAELRGLIAEEVSHCAHGHPWRRGSRDPLRWNIACDLSILWYLKESGFDIPEDSLLADERFRGKSAEWIYEHLPPGQTAAPGRGGVDDGGEGGESEVEWGTAVKQAVSAAAKARKLPSGMDRFVQNTERPADLRQALLRFIEESLVRDDYSWASPSKRYIASGVYLPDLRGEEIGPLAIVLDTSGSIDPAMLNRAGATISGVALDLKPRCIWVLHADAKVHRVQKFERGEAVELKPKGGGGTDFRPAFQCIEELEERPLCVVYFTDLEGTFPKEAPEIPVLWVTESRDKKVPFGEKVVVG